MSKFVEVKVPSGLDIVSDIQLSSKNQLILSSWDNQVLIYDCTRASSELIVPVGSIHTPSTPLSLLYTDTKSAFVGSLDGSICQIDYENMKLDQLVAGTDGQVMGQGINKMSRVHDNPNVIIASSFGGVFNVVDVRQRAVVGTTRVGGNKIFTMDTSRDYLTVGLNGNHIEIYDIRQLSVPFEERELGLKYQIKDLRCRPDNQGFAVSTVDGRVSLECFDSAAEVQDAARFTFKCHRQHDKTCDTDIVYAVNSVVFAPDGSLFTGGADGAVCEWDCVKRKRIKMFPKFSQSVAKLAYGDGVLAVATSDDSFIRARRLSDPVNARVPSQLYVRTVI